jgi:transcriptional repressor NrdR
MICPFCLHKKTNVYNSRQGSKLNAVWRRRQCGACGGQFTTYESAEPGSILTVREGDGGRTLTPFSHTNLLLSLLKACDHRADLDDSVPYLCDTIEQQLYKLHFSIKEKTITKQNIVRTTADVLKRYDPVAYVKYAGRYQAQMDAPAIRRALRRKK